MTDPRPHSPPAPEALSAPDAPATCWSCRGPVGRAVPACPVCGAVQPPGAADHFTRLGLPRAYDLAPATLDRAYFGLQRTLHPDRYARRAPRERLIAESQSVAVNEAYETLRDPLRRAVYLLALLGDPIPEDGRTVDDPALLAEAMEMREALSEAEGADAVARLADAAAGDLERCRAALAEAFASGDVAGAKRQTLRCRYLARLADEIRRRRAQPAAAGPAAA